MPFFEDKDFSVRLLAVGRLLEGSQREVFWEVNGKPRLLTLEDKKVAEASTTVRRRAKVG